MFLILDSHGHNDPELVEVTQEELTEIYRVEGNKYLYDTDEGKEWIKKLHDRAIKNVNVITVYI